jgi:RNA-directed DNA polymerase
MVDRGHAPAPQLALPVAERRGEAAGGAAGPGTPVGEARVMERVVERGKRLAARRRVTRPGGSPGLDGMPVEAWPGYLREHGPGIREGLRAGT